jgi:hypothetical protein
VSYAEMAYREKIRKHHKLLEPCLLTTEQKATLKFDIPCLLRDRGPKSLEQLEYELIADYGWKQAQIKGLIRNTWIQLSALHDAGVVTRHKADSGVTWSKA